MRILHINSYFNGRIFYKNFFDKQIEHDLDIEVYVPVPYSKIPLNNELGNYTTISPNHRSFDRILFYTKHKKILKDIINKYDIRKFSVIHAHSLFSNGYIAMKLKEKFGIPYIAAVRNTDLNTFFKKMPHLRKIGVKILKEANKIIFLSEAYKYETIEKYVPKKMKEGILSKSDVIPNGIDNFWLENRATAKKINKNKTIKLLYVGVINKNKNLLTTIEAIEYLLKEGYNITYTIVGKIEDKFVYNQVKRKQYVKYISPKKKEDLIKIYRNNDIFVMPSKAESFGLVYAEAMSQGLPVIYSKGQGFDGQFDEGKVGYHVDSENPIDIKESIKSILKNYDEISMNCVKLCSKFCWRKIENKYKKIYDDVIKQNVQFP